MMYVVCLHFKEVLFRIV